jgi:hypothetical protein
MIIRWVLLENKFVPELEIFDDAWYSLSNMHDLIDILGKHNNEDTTPEKFIQFLLTCGFKDMTK